MSKFFIYGNSVIDIERIVKIISYKNAEKPHFTNEVVTDDKQYTLLITEEYAESLTLFIERYEKEKTMEHNLRMRLLRAVAKEKENNLCSKN